MAVIKTVQTLKLKYGWDDIVPHRSRLQALKNNVGIWQEQGPAEAFGTLLGSNYRHGGQAFNQHGNKMLSPMDGRWNALIKGNFKAKDGGDYPPEVAALPHVRLRNMLTMSKSRSKSKGSRGSSPRAAAPAPRRSRSRSVPAYSPEPPYVSPERQTPPSPEHTPSPPSGAKRAAGQDTL